MPGLVTVCRKAVCALSVLFVFGSGTALAQDKLTLRSLDARLARIERVLDQSLLEQLQRVDSLQREIRSLRGEIESLNYEIDKVTKRNADLYADTDRRVTELEESQNSLDLLNAEAGLSEDDLSGGGFLDETAQAPTGITEDAPAVFVAQPRASVPAANTADFGNGPRPPTGALRDTATQAEKAGYTRAYDLLVRGQNESAVRSFNEFLVSFPDGPYSDNAWYWQGEAMYAQRDFDSALRNFGVVVNSFPSSTKVPDARLKIGFALYEQRRFGEARSILTGVQNDYPGRSAAVLARKRLQKMDRDGQ
ncbi:MAG: tol-pal system protein YbgF [Granulosicoccus sp.]